LLIYNIREMERDKRGVRKKENKKRGKEGERIKAV
jgi:hypothetical protein